MTYHIEQSKQTFDKIMDLSEFVKVIEDSYPILPDHIHLCTAELGTTNMNHFHCCDEWIFLWLIFFLFSYS
jgi:hypothetical protein